MHDDRAPGPTFAMADLGWIDFETRGRLPISVGTDLYTRNAQAIMLAWAIGDGPMQVEAVSDLDRPLRWADMPRPLRAFVDRVLAGEAWLVAHNAGFDRAIWNNATDGFPELGPYDFVDTRVQAAASGLPAALNFAALYAGGPKKDSAGRDLIKLFTLADSVAAPQTHPAEWAAFRNYALGDIDAMRGLFRRTRQLPLAEWEEYWAAEMINDTGIGIDLAMVEAATAMAAHDRQHTSGELRVLTEDFVGTVNEVKNLVYWLAERLPADGRAILTERVEERDPATGEVVKPHKWSLTRDRIVRLLAYLDSLDPFPEALHAARRVLQIRLYGGSKTPTKFGRMLTSHVDGILRSQYVFNGASQTGRFCLAEGSLILVRTNGVVGEKPIERVSIADEVWDGETWVAHDGIRFSGDKGVIEHDGVVATPEHIVYLNTNYRISLGEAKALGAPIWQGEIDVSDLQTDKPVRSFLRRHNINEDV